ncbi:hypothetical protein ETB97_000350 [Aspergillus alliaceus]|uniref:Cytochrome P450 n=1 Tax=Petromyces alliaceus TaxID=209559 RepID=A0A8H6A5Z2_PETAA|nr:hypothetical protein ETB97_000350 [Aspergillus burnettii]
MVIKRSELYAFSLGILIHIFYFRVGEHHLYPARPLFRKLADLHETYGSFVRIGPSDLSIVHPKATSIIYGFKSTCTKSAWYDGSAPLKSLHAHRIRADHDKHRRIWNPGFTDRALHGYEKRIQVYRQKLINQITSADDDEPVNISTLFTWYGYDVMGDLAFGQSFDMLEKSSTHWAVLLILSMLKPVEYLMPIWFFRLSVSIPFASKAFWKFNEYWGQLFRTRMATKQEIPDISACLLEPLKGRTPTTDEFNGLLGDASLIINAGGDTTATTLTTIVYELARRPLEVQKLRAELAVCTTDANGEYAHENLTTLKQLNGVINETLRIHSPVPSYIPRKTPPEGIDIEAETVYQNAQDFIPERWYLYPEMIKERSAYAPFTTGPYTCIGKPLALMNIRATIARLVTAFNMELAPGDDGRALERSMREHFSIYMADDIRVIFRKCAI